SPRVAAEQAGAAKETKEKLDPSFHTIQNTNGIQSFTQRMSQMAQAQIQTRLCPHCANSITFDAMKCPYCRADLLPSTEPEWPHNDEYVERSNLSVEKERLTVKSKAILILGLVVFALGVYLVGGNRERSDLRPVLEEHERTLQDKDATIKDLEAQL